MTSRVMLLSGGVDSTALTHLIRPDRALVIDYGQVCANAEVLAAQGVSTMLQIPLDVVRIDCSKLGSGDLSGKPALSGLAPSSEWWPYRNLLLACLAAGQTIGANGTELIFGTVLTDRFHADGSPEFFHRLDALLSMQEGNLHVSTPAIEWTTEELIKQSGAGLEVLGWTHSCHVSNSPCGVCRGCEKRRRVLENTNLWP